MKKIGRPKKQFCPQGHDTFLCGREPKNRSCKICSRQRVRDNRHKYPKDYEKLRKYGREYYKRNPKSAREQAWKQKGVLNMDGTRFRLSDYNRLLESQKYSCSICGCRQQTNKAFDVDHDHKTGVVRGLLCHKHNNLLGCANDSVEILEAGIRYLKIHQLQQEILK
jgi:hypothetical protein